MASQILTMWVIYERPRDKPDWFVLRQVDVVGGEIEHHAECVLCKTLEEARGFIPPGLVNVGRHKDDDPVIAEVWL